MHIGFAFHDPHSAFWAILGYAARARAAELGATITVTTASDVDTQVEAIQRLVSQQVDVLLIGPIDSYGLGPVVQQAIDAGIPVVAVDMAIEGCQLACTVLSDNLHRRGGRSPPFWSISSVGRVQLAHLQGPPTAHTAVQRSQGVHNVLDGHAGCADRLRGRRRLDARVWRDG